MGEEKKSNEERIARALERIADALWLMSDEGVLVDLGDLSQCVVSGGGDSKDEHALRVLKVD